MTLFIFKKRPIEVTLFTASENAFRFARPQKATNFLPDWWKNLPKRTHREDLEQKNVSTLIRTMKTCPGFIDLYSKGFMQPLWSDLSVQIEPDGGFRYQYADGVSAAQEHSGQQMAGSHFSRSHNHLKLTNPWAAKANTDTKFLACAPVWNGFGADDVCVVPGVTGYKVPLELNINIFFRRHHETKVYDLEFGQPISHFIPLSDRPIKLNYELVSDQDRTKMIKNGGMYMFFENRYKKAAKLCPYA